MSESIKAILEENKLEESKAITNLLSAVFRNKEKLGEYSFKVLDSNISELPVAKSFAELLCYSGAYVIIRLDNEVATYGFTEISNIRVSLGWYEFKITNHQAVDRAIKNESNVEDCKLFVKVLTSVRK